MKLEIGISKREVGLCMRVLCIQCPTESIVGCAQNPIITDGESEMIAGVWIDRWVACDTVGWKRISLEWPARKPKPPLLYACLRYTLCCFDTGPTSPFLFQLILCLHFKELPGTWQ